MSDQIQVIRIIIFAMPRTQESIKVMVRIKPPPLNTVYRNYQNEKILHCGQKTYNFDQIFAPDDGDQHVFERVGFDLVENAIEGYNSTLFVYGQTGTGKTYTMNGDAGNEGIMQKSIRLLKQKLERDPRFDNFHMKMSFFEIYNEKVRDLLNDNIRGVRQRAKEGFFVQHLEEVELGSLGEFNNLFRKGNLLRLTKATEMNEQSSRSHSILTITLETKQLIGDTRVIKTSKINFVDLAGSQKIKQTKVTGDRKIQAGHINLSLEALRKVISILEQKRLRNITHIPYRDSVLTQLLKDSLGGNSHTVIIGTISSKSDYIKETISTLNFLQLARKVKNSKVVNEKVNESIERMTQRINFCGQKLDRLEAAYDDAMIKLSESKALQQQYLQEIRQLKERLMQLERPISIFENGSKTKSDYIELYPSQKPLSFNDGLTNISQRDYDGSSSPDRRGYQSQYGVKASHSEIINSSAKGKKKYEGDANVSLDHLLLMEIKYLKDNVDRYSEECLKYGNLLNLVQQNLESLAFDEAQMNILELQAHELQFTKDSLQRAEGQNRQLLRLHQEEKISHQLIIAEFKKTDLDNISKQSQLISKESKMTRENHSMIMKINSLEDELESTYNKFSQQKRQLQRSLDEQINQKEKIFEEMLSIRHKFHNLSDAMEFQENNFKAWVKQLEQQSQSISEKKIKEISEQYERKLTMSEKQKEEQFKQANKKAIQFIKVLEDLLQEIKDEKGQLLSQQLQEKSRAQELRNYNEDLRAQILDYSQTIKQLQEQLGAQKQRVEYFNIEGIQFTADELIELYLTQKQALDNKSEQLYILRQNQNQLQYCNRRLSDQSLSCHTIITSVCQDSSQKIQLLQSQLQTKANLVEELERKYHLQRRDNQNLSFDVRRLERQKDELKQQFGTQVSSITKEASEQIEHLKKEIKRLQNVIDENIIRKKRIDAFVQPKLEQYFLKCQKLQEQKDCLELKLQYYKQRNEKLEGRSIKGYQRQFNEKTVIQQSSYIFEIEKENLRLGSKNKHQNISIQELKEMNSELKEQIKDLKKSLSKVNDKLQEKISELMNLKIEIEKQSKSKYKNIQRRINPFNN